MGDEVKHERSGPSWAAFNDMTWPRAGNYGGDVEWRLRHAREHVTPSDMVVAASILAAYRELVHCPERKRRLVVRALREVERTNPYSSEDES